MFASRRALVLGFTSLLGAELALAIPVTYQFSTDPISGAVTITPPASPTPHQELLNAWAGLTVIGSFVYDNEAAAIGTGGIGLIQNRTVYGAITDITGSVGSLTFSDPTGAVSAANEGFILPPPLGVPPSDFFELSLE